MANIWTLIVAAGTGTRFGGSVPKQFIEVAGRRIVEWSTVAAAPVSEGVVIVVPANGDPVTISDETAAAVAAHECELRFVVGGATRSESVRAGLNALPETVEVVLVHDAARPVASPQLFGRVAEAVLAGAGAVIPVVAVVDTIRDVDGNSVDRAKLRAVQTPQGFVASVLRDAHDGGADATDDATLAQQAGARVVTVEGERWNLKVTTPDDELVVAALLGGRR